MNGPFILGYTTIAILFQTKINFGLNHFLIFIPQGIEYTVFNFFIFSVSTSTKIMCFHASFFVHLVQAVHLGYMYYWVHLDYSISMGPSTVMLTTSVGKLCCRILYEIQISLWNICEDQSALWVLKLFLGCHVGPGTWKSSPGSMEIVWGPNFFIH